MLHAEAVREKVRALKLSFLLCVSGAAGRSMPALFVMELKV